MILGNDSRLPAWMSTDGSRDRMSCMLVSEPVRPGERWQVTIETREDEPAWSIGLIEVCGVVEGVWLTSAGMLYRAVDPGILTLDEIWLNPADPYRAVVREPQRGWSGGRLFVAQGHDDLVLHGFPISLRGRSGARPGTPALNACVTIVAEAVP